MRSKLKPPPPECRVPDALLVGDEARAPAPLAGVVRAPVGAVALDVLLVAPAVLAGLDVLPVDVLAVELRGGVLLLELLGAAALLALRAGRAAALLDDGRDAGAVDPVVSKDSLSKSKNPMFVPSGSIWMHGEKPSVRYRTKKRRGLRRKDEVRVEVEHRMSRSITESR
jgi:hypothetical protein